MNNPLIDVEIYLNTFKSTITDLLKDDHDTVADDYGIEDIDRFLDIFFEDAEIVATSNFYENGDPILSESQYIDTLGKSIAQYHIDSLMENGLIESTFDESDMESKFRLTDTGQVIANELKNINSNLN